MIGHNFVTRDSTVTVTCDSRVVSHDLSQCPDPTRPDPLVSNPSIVSHCGRSGRHGMSGYAAIFAGGF